METNNQKNDQNIIPNDADKQQKGVNVPNLRFKDDDDSYSKTIYESICDISTGNKNTQDKIDNGIYPFYVRSNTIERINNYTFDGEAILTAGDGVGVGKVFHYVKGKIGVHQRVYLLSNFRCCAKYLFYHFSSRFYDRVKIMSAKNSVDSVRYDMIAKMKIYLPAKTQIQEKVANFFSLLDQRIDTQSKIIEKYESLISTIRTNIFSSFQCKWTKLCDLVENKSLQLNRGNIIPKHPKDDVYKYPVYSSSVQKDGLMGYSDYYMFDKELITWSIDGGGDIFFREKHKFCVTNVCGILQLDTNKFSYRFVAEALKYQHSKMTFDYQTKAHPSVIEKLYALPDIELNEQNKYSKLFEVLYSKLGNERKYLEIIKEQKKYLLSNMFI